MLVSAPPFSPHPRQWALSTHHSCWLASWAGCTYSDGFSLGPAFYSLAEGQVPPRLLDYHLPISLWEQGSQNLSSWSRSQYKREGGLNKHYSVLEANKPGDSSIWGPQDWSPNYVQRATTSVLWLEQHLGPGNSLLWRAALCITG